MGGLNFVFLKSTQIEKKKPPKYDLQICTEQVCITWRSYIYSGI